MKVGESKRTINKSGDHYKSEIEPSRNKNQTNKSNHGFKQYRVPFNVVVRHVL